MKKLIKNPNFIIIIVLAVIGAVMLCASLLRPGADTVTVKVDGKIVASYQLSDNGTYIIEGVSGTNTLVIEDGQAYISEATCPDGLCVKTGHIHATGQSIICLPNRVVVEITRGSASDIDALSR